MTVTLKVRPSGSSGAWTTLPTPKTSGLELTVNRLWSSDSGRVASGDFVGTCIGNKKSIKLEWPRLSGTAAQTVLQAALDSDFVSLSCTGLDGTAVTITGYFSSPSYVLVRGGVVDRLTVELVEK